MLYDSTILYRSFYVFVAASALFGLFLVYLVRPVESHREFVVHSLSTFEIVAVVAAVVYFVLVDLYFYLGYFDCCFALVDLAFWSFLLIFVLILLVFVVVFILILLLLLLFL